MSKNLIRKRLQQKLIAKGFVPTKATETFEQNLNKINALIGKESPRAAHSLYRQIEKEIKKELNRLPVDPLSDVFVNACVITIQKGNFDYLKQVIDIFKIDLKTLKIHYDDRLFTPMSFLLAINGEDTYSLKAEYIKLLTNHKLHPDDKVNSESLNITLLMQMCFNGDLMSARVLIENGANINLETFLEDGETRMYRTPFSMAISAKKIELIEFLLKNGADPLKAGNLIKNYYLDKGGILPPNLTIFPVLSCDGKFSWKSDGEYLNQVFNLIDKYYTDKILFSVESQEIKVPEVKASELAKQEHNTTEQLLADYIAFKQDPLVEEQDRQREGKPTLEGKFDLLLLQFIRSSQKQDLKNLYSYIEDNPELNLYDSTGILDMLEYNEASHVLSNKRKIIQEFFSLKKSSHDTYSLAEEMGSLKGATQVQATSLKHKLYIATSPELEDDRRYTPAIKEKILKSLEKVKFIPANSKGQYGIKAYGGVIKLKCADNLYIYATKKYCEENTRTSLIIFDKIGDHKEIEEHTKSNKRLATEKVPSLTTILQSFQQEVTPATEEDTQVAQPLQSEEARELLEFTELTIAPVYLPYMLQYIKTQGEVILTGDMRIFDGLEQD